jgi:hypothetical protein
MPLAEPGRCRISTRPGSRIHAPRAQAVEPAGIGMAEAVQHRPVQRQRMPPQRQTSRR